MREIHFRSGGAYKVLQDKVLNDFPAMKWPFIMPLSFHIAPQIERARTRIFWSLCPRIKGGENDAVVCCFLPIYGINVNLRYEMRRFPARSELGRGDIGEAEETR